MIVLLRALSNLSGLFPVLTGRRHRNMLWYYCWASFLIDITSLLLKTIGQPFNWLANVFFVLELILVGLFMDRQLFGGGRGAVLNKLLIAALLAYYIQDTVRTSVLEPNMEGIAPAYVYYVVLMLMAFRKALSQIEYMHIQRSPIFIFCAGFFVYASGVSLIFLFQRYLVERNQDFLNRLWVIMNLLNILKHAGIGYYFMLKEAKVER